MIAGSVHASSHNHEDEHDHHHHGEFEAECVVCIVASLQGAKLTPGAPGVVTPLALPVVKLAFVHRFSWRLNSAKAHTARAPPLSGRSE
ncbi:MAG: DUF2946 family protein [Pseudomonadota bacterium]